MYGLNAKGLKQAQHLKNGGPVRGPGTGTSDSIPAVVPEGSYIMPADSTAQIGEGALAQMGARGLNAEPLRQYEEAAAPAAGGTGRGFGAKGLGEHAKGARAGGAAGEAPGLGFKAKDIPVNLSNGEFQLPPEQVHGVGVAVLNALKDATHTPAALQQAGALFFADGGAVESTEELLARIQAKYGTGGGAAPSAPRAAPVQPQASTPAPRAMTAPTIAGAADALRNRRQQIDAAAGFADGGDVEDPEKPRAVAGAPGVQRVGNTYSAAPEASTRTPTMGQTMNRINNERVERMGGKGMYQPAIEEAGRAAAGAFSNTRTAIRGAGDNIAESYQAGGLPAAVGATVRNTMVPAIGFAHDVAASAKQLLDPAANALKTAVTGDPTPIGAEPASATPARGVAGLAKFAGIDAIGKSPATTGTATTSGVGAADGLGGLAQQERNTAGDAYRDAWQQQAPGGLRGAGANALDLYNAEQMIRGTGITAQRDANGRMAFSGDGTNALPQNYTSGVDLNLANQRMARANAIRGETVALQQALADKGKPTAGSVAGIADPDVARRAEAARNNLRSDIVRQATTPVPGAKGITARQRDDLASVMQADDAWAGRQMQHGQQDRRLALDEQTAQTNQALGAARFGLDTDRNALERQRLGLEQQKVGSELAERGFGIRGLQQMEQLRQQYEVADTPEKRAALAEQIRVFSGKEAPNRFTVVPGGQEWDAQAGAMRTVPARVLNNQTGEFVGAGQGRRQPAPPPGMTHVNWSPRGNPVYRNDKGELVEHTPD